MTAVEPATAAPQADRSFLRELLDEVMDLRGDITAAANFVAAKWPMPAADRPYLGSPVLEDGFDRCLVGFHYRCRDAGELRVLRMLLAHGTEDDDLRVDAGHPQQPSVCRRFGRVTLHVWAFRPVWEQAYPEEVEP